MLYEMYSYVILLALSTPMAKDRVNSFTYILSLYYTLIFYLLCLYHCTCTHLSSIHLYTQKNDSNDNLFSE